MEKSSTLDYLKLIKESPEKKLSYIFAGVTIGFSILLIVFAIRPTILTITTINKEIKEKNTVNLALETKINTMSKLDEQYQEIGDDLETLALIYPTGGNFSLLMSNIEAITSRNGYDLRSVNFTDYKNDSYDITNNVVEPWNVRLSVIGKKVNLINLLRDIESLPMYPVVEVVSYSSADTEDGQTTFAITLRVYHIDNSNFYE